MPHTVTFIPLTLDGSSAESDSHETSKLPKFVDLAPSLPDIRQVVIEGLSRTPKSLPAWLLYDPKGADLFETICEQPEYYVTRTEMELLGTHGGHIAEFIGEDALLVELGGSSCRKIRRLLQSIPQPVAYMPVDIAGESLQQSAREVHSEFPHVRVFAVCADFTDVAALPISGLAKGRVVFFFPGSTIGNFEPAAARALLTGMAQAAGPRGGVIVGVDLKKDKEVLDAAYNDEAGATERFETNILDRLNRDLKMGFRTEDFAYDGAYNEKFGRVEMRLKVVRRTQATLGDKIFEFTPNEEIRLEHSYKFTLAEFQKFAKECGLKPIEAWTDARKRFSLHLLEVAS